MIAEGKKTIETRTWRTNYRGRILLVASKKPAGKYSGHAFAVATIVAVHPMQEHEVQAACCPRYKHAMSWVLSDVKPLANPFPVKGKLSLFEVPINQP